MVNCWKKWEETMGKGVRSGMPRVTQWIGSKVWKSENEANFSAWAWCTNKCELLGPFMEFN